MTDRQRHVLEIMADPVNQITSLSARDREAIAAALARIDELERADDGPEGKRPRRGKAGPQPYYRDDDL